MDLHIDDDVAMVTVVGDLDLTTAPRLRDVLQMLVHDVETVTLDMEHVTYMDVAGLQTLLLFERTPRKLYIRASSRSVRRLLELARGEELLGEPEPHQDGNPMSATKRQIRQIRETR